MFVRFNKTLLGDYGHARKGDVREVSKAVGEKLIRLKYVTETKGPAKSGAVAKNAKAVKAEKAAKAAPSEPSTTS